jgi:VCBS repeat-containing protein
VLGGTPAENADFVFLLDSLRVTKNGNANFFFDDFNDGVAPPNGPLGAETYAIGAGGAVPEAGGRAILAAAGGVLGVAPGTPDPFITTSAVLRTNIDPGNLAAGLKIDDDFAVEGLFDLIIPDDYRESYGIRLRDRLVGGPGMPPDQLGDDVIELMVLRSNDGILRVQLRERDFVADSVTFIESTGLNPPAGADQILLRLSHEAASPGAVTASFDYLAGGVVVGSHTFGNFGHIFGAETPFDPSDDEVWTRAEVIAWSPEVTGSTLSGVYGSLTIGQDGVWNYALNNSLSAVQGLAEGETAVDTFQVVVTDEHGASDTETVTITVTGSNDAPTLISGDAARSLEEDEAAPNLTATGLAFFNDVDLIDTHTLNVSLASATLSTGGALSPDLQAALEAAISTLLLDPATGDGAGQYQWDFALDNALVQFLNQGETLTAVYSIAITDNHNAAAVQQVTITVAGVDDGFSIVGDTSGGVTEDAPLEMQTSGYLSGTGSGALNWSIPGGSTSPQTQDFRFQVDNLKIVKNGNLFFEDAFDNGVPPPSAPNIGPNPATYTVNGTITEAAGRALMDGTHAVQFGATGYGLRAMLNTDINTAANPAGLKRNSDFTAEARFDLIMPEDVGDVYGIRLTDQNSAPPNNNSTVDLVVMRDGSGVQVAFRHINISSSIVTVLETFTLAPGSNDQIVLRVDYDQSSYISFADGGKVTASFDLMSNGAVTSSHNFTAEGTIFRNEDFTRVQLVAQTNQSETGVHKIAGIYGTLTLAQDGQWHYFLADHQANVQALAQGETVTESFQVQASDGLNTEQTTIDVQVTGVNDAPDIVGGSTFGTVQEDSQVQATGQLTAVDPDNGAVLTWSVAGGPPSVGANYNFTADALVVIRGGNVILSDQFSDGLPPPNSPPFNAATPTPTPTSYLTIGGFEETGGRLIFDSDNAVPLVSVGTSDPFIGQIANVATNIDPNNQSIGLKYESNFAVRGLFDLVIPDSPREAYGIRLSDRLIGGPGTPPDDPGDDTYELLVRKNLFGQDVVSLRHVNFVNDTVTHLENISLVPVAGADQIRLSFDHAANSTQVQASFQYFSAGVAIGPVQTFTATASVFGTDAYDTQLWTRAGIIAFAPQFTDSATAGTYGSFTVNQAGNWTYAVNSALAATQSLAAGQTVQETFTVQVSDEFGAADTTTVTVNVVGTNDAPFMQTNNTSRVVVEGDSVLAETGLGQFVDVDLADTHMLVPVLVATVTAGGATISPALAATLTGAMSMTMLDPATGDGNGQYRWDFAIDDSVIAYLAAGESVSAVYELRVIDPSGTIATQIVTIQIDGIDNAIMGTPWPDNLHGTPGDDTIFALESEDVIVGGLGNDTIDGGPGTDISVHAGLMASYSIADDGVTVVVSGPDGTDTLIDVEMLQFDDAFLLTSMGAFADLTDVQMFNANPLYGTVGDEAITVGSLAASRLIDLGDGMDTVYLGLPGFQTYFMELANVELLQGRDDSIESVWLSSGVDGLTVDLGIGFDSLHLGPGGNTVHAINVETIVGGAGVDVVDFTPAAFTSNQEIWLGTEDTVNLIGSDFFIFNSAGTVNSAAGSDVTVNLLNLQAGTHFNFGAGPASPTPTPWSNNVLNLWTDGSGVTDVKVSNVDLVNGTGYADHITVLGNSGYNASGITVVHGGGGADMIWAGPGNAERFLYTSISDSPAGLGRDTIFNLHDAWDVIDLRGLGVSHVELADFGGNLGLQIFVGGGPTPAMEINLPGLQGSPGDGYALFYDHVWI